MFHTLEKHWYLGCGTSGVIDTLFGVIGDRILGYDINFAWPKSKGWIVILGHWIWLVHRTLAICVTWPWFKDFPWFVSLVNFAIFPLQKWVWVKICPTFFWWTDSNPVFDLEVYLLILEFLQVSLISRWFIVLHFLMIIQSNLSQISTHVKKKKYLTGACLVCTFTAPKILVLETIYSLYFLIQVWLY